MSIVILLFLMLKVCQALSKKSLHTSRHQVQMYHGQQQCQCLQHLCVALKEALLMILERVLMVFLKWNLHFEMQGRRQMKLGFRTMVRFKCLLMILSLMYPILFIRVTTTTTMMMKKVDFMILMKMTLEQVNISFPVHLLPCGIE